MFPFTNQRPDSRVIHRENFVIFAKRSQHVVEIYRGPDFAMKGGKSKADTSKKADTRLSTKRRGMEKAKKTVKKAKAGKDPNKPKRPPSAFFVFMEEFRKQFKEKNPNNKLVSVVGKAGGDKWKSMSDADKAPYVAKANKYKTEYTKNMAAYNAAACSHLRRPPLCTYFPLTLELILMQYMDLSVPISNIGGQF
ncbi:hypothetical protein COCNU_09G005440 [Cocos nucifera]|uniref:HMG box domain-containing protein n=1 Tax=Cocos nucifera TaxID=13894 RepID=A0A8K0N7V7_COCNU|nr:hypothetical protein COCNU_09G005440 [Cocos nucifera]